MNKKDILEYLNKLNICYELFEHKRVYNMEEVKEINLPYPELDAKNLFIRDDKRQNYYLVSIIGSKRLDLKELRKKENLRPLTFASSEELELMLKLEPGSVTPFGLLNTSYNVIFYIDEDFLNKKIGIHPNSNDATVFLNTSDLIDIIKLNGNTVKTIKL